MLAAAQPSQEDDYEGATACQDAVYRRTHCFKALQLDQRPANLPLQVLLPPLCCFQGWPIGIQLVDGKLHEVHRRRKARCQVDDLRGAANGVTRRRLMRMLKTNNICRPSYVQRICRTQTYVRDRCTLLTLPQSSWRSCCDMAPRDCAAPM